MTHYLRAHYPNGVLGVDSTANEKSLAYGATARSGVRGCGDASTRVEEQPRNGHGTQAKEMRAIHEMRGDHEVKRRANLGTILQGEKTHGYDPYQHDPSYRPGIRFLQAKTPGLCQPPWDTHAHISVQNRTPRGFRAFWRSGCLLGRQIDQKRWLPMQFRAKMVEI